VRDALAKIKSILVAHDFGQRYDYFLLKDERILVTDGRMSASTPYAHGVDRLVPGLELDLLVSRFEGAIEITEGTDLLTLKSGRLRGTIQTLESNSVQIPSHDGDWAHPPDGLMAAMRVARPFVTDVALTAQMAWGACLCLKPERVLATNTVSLVSVDVPGLLTTDDEGALLPAWATDFVLGFGADPDGIMFTESYAAFRWPDGTQLLAQLVLGSFPPHAAKLLTNIAPDQPVPINESWRKAYLTVAEISEGIIAIEPGKITGGQGRGKVEHEVELPGLTGAIYFDPKVLTPAITQATHWAPGIYPDPVPFVAPGVRGLVMGRRAP
jgi:hypothetical protein